MSEAGQAEQTVKATPVAESENPATTTDTPAERTTEVTAESEDKQTEKTDETKTSDSEDKTASATGSAEEPAVPAPTDTETGKQSDEQNETSNKRSADELEPEQKSKKAKSENAMVFKMLCPFWCAGAVIGTKGVNLRQMKEETGCVIRITRNHENFPMTSERVVSMKGDVESIKKVIQSVQHKIRTDKPPPNAPSKDNTKRKGCMKLVVSVSSAGRIIGKGGEQTKKLQSLHGVHVDVMKTADLPPGLNESVITISGEDNERIDNCMADIVALVAEDTRANLNYFVNYADFSQNRQPPPHQFGGWGGPPGPQHFPPMWGGQRQNFNQNFRDQYSRPGGFHRR